LKIAGFLLFGLIGVIFGVSQVRPVAATPANLDVDEVRARNFLVLGPDGQVRAKFGIDAGDGQPLLNMRDRNDNIAVWLGTYAPANGGGGVLGFGNTVRDDASRSRLFIRVYDDDRPAFITASDESGHEVWRVP
jgi:hypothetical protein